VSVSRIRVLYCIDALPSGGGTENQLAGLIRRLDRARFAVDLCTLRRAPNQPDLPDTTLVPLDASSLARPGAWRELGRLARHLRGQSVDVVQTFFQDATLAGAFAARRAGVPVRLASFRDLGFWRTRRQEWLMRRAYPLLTGFVANSEAVKAHFVDADRLPAERVAVIPNGLDADGFAFTPHPGREGPAIGLVGNLNRAVKRADLFLEAAGIVARDRPDATWRIVGDGELRPACEARAAALGLGARAVFTGRTADVPGELAKLAVGVICSDSEGFSNAVLEYMLCGCAVVATDVGGNREAVRHGETGLLVPPGDAPALAAAIRSLLDDPARRQALAARARAEAESRWSWARCVADHEALYARLVAATGREGADVR
jgi:L-malate glycosyltransferase